MLLIVYRSFDTQSNQKYQELFKSQLHIGNFDVIGLNEMIEVLIFDSLNKNCTDTS